MSASSFSAALARVLAHEGGYTNHPSDPGGPTNFGITIADYRKYVKPGAVAADVRAMRRDEARAIYKAHYWDAMRCDDLPAGLDYAVFDYGVNSGINRAVKVLQRLMGIAADGRMSDAVLAAVARSDVADIIARLCDERLTFLRRLRTWPVFAAGWSRRVAEVRAVALAMARAGAASARSEVSAGANDVPARVPVRTGAAAVAAAVGAAITQWAHHGGARPIVIAGTVIAVVACAVAGWLVWWRRQRRVQQASK